MGEEFTIRAKVTLNTKDIQKQLDGITVPKVDAHVDSNIDDISLSFQSANYIFTRTVELIKEMAEEVFELDGALTEFQKVSDLTGIQLDKYVNKLNDAGKIVGRTASEMVDAATMFRKNSFTDEDSARLATVAATYQNVSDTAITAGDSASFIISQMKAFNIEAENAESIIDKVNEVANNYAVGTNDLSKALEVAGAGLSTYNNTFEETIALVTSGTEIMVGRSQQVARGLNTIASRLVKNQDLLAKYGITTTDANGELLSTFDILTQLHTAWQDMSSAEQVALGVELAGVNQYKVLAAVMTNFDTALNANVTAQKAAGSAAEENARYMEHLEARVNLLKAEFQDFANSVLSSDFIKALLDIANGLLKLANTDLGRVISQVLLFSTTMWSFSKLVNIAGWLQSIGAEFANFASLVKTGSIAIEGAGGAITTVTGGLAAFKATAFPVIAILTSLIILFKKLYDVWKEDNPTLEESQKLLKSYNEQLENNQKRLDEISQMSWQDKSPDIYAEVTALEKENKELRENIELQEKRTKKAAIRESQDFYGLNVGAYSYALIGRGKETVAGSFTQLTTPETYEEAIAEVARMEKKTVDEVKQLIKDGFIEIQSNAENLLTYNYSYFKRQEKDYEEVLLEGTAYSKQQLKELTGYTLEELEELEKAGKAVVNKTENVVYMQGDQLNQFLSNQMQDWFVSLASSGELVGEQAENYNNYIETIYGLVSTYKQLQASGVELTDTQTELLRVFGRFSAVENVYHNNLQYTKSSIEDVIETYKVWQENADEIANKQKLITSVLSDFNKYGQLSSSTINSLNELYPDLLEHLYDANGALTAEAKAALQSAQSFVKLVAEQTILNNSTLDVSGKIQELTKLAIAAGVSADAVAGLRSNLYSLGSGYTAPEYDVYAMMDAYQANKPGASRAEAAQWVNQQIAEQTYQGTKEALTQSYLNSILKALDTTVVPPSGGGGGSTTLTPQEKELQQRKSALDLAKQQLAYLEASGATEEERIAKMQEIQGLLHAVASYMRQINGLAEDGSEDTADIVSLSTEWWSYASDIKELYDQIDENLKNAEKKVSDITDDYQNAVGYLASAVETYADEQIAALQEQIDKLDEANEELEQQILLEEKLDALARARQTKVLVYKDGAFQYVEDIDAVSEAASDLAEFERQQELEAQKANIQAQINELERLKNIWASLPNAYNDEQNKLLVYQQLGIDLQNANFEEMLRNAEAFVNTYKNIMAGMAQAGGASIIDAMRVNSAEWATADAERKIELANTNYALGTAMGWSRDEASGIWYTDASHTVRAYANGTANAIGGMSLVGEQGAELRILNTGDGVLPSNITKNLWKWGQTTPSSLASNFGKMNVSIGSINLPNVKDGESFVNYLRNNFFGDIMQFAH